MYIRIVAQAPLSYKCYLKNMFINFTSLAGGGGGISNGCDVTVPIPLCFSAACVSRALCHHSRISKNDSHSLSLFFTRAT